MSLVTAPNCVTGCPAAQLARTLPEELRGTKAGYASLLALFAPGLMFALGLFLARGNPKFMWLSRPALYPWQLWVIACCGTLATAAGVGDWIFHRWKAKCVIPKKEKNCELLALAGGGIPMFVLMAAASLNPVPQRFLIPVLAVLIFTVVLICYDEFIFHRRRCRRFETILHRLLVFGNGTAWMAWAHWCFVKGGIYA